MPVKGGPNIRTSQAIVWLDAADKSSYPGTGTTWINSVTPGTYNGTLTNTSFNSTDALGALFFSGSNTFADMGNIGAISASYTFQVAVKPLPTGSPYTILSYTSGSGTGSVTFRLDYSSSIQTAVFSAFASSGSVNKTYNLSTVIPTGSWSILHGRLGNGVLSLFRNGFIASSTIITGSFTGYSSNNRFLVGGVSLVTGSYLSGSIGNVSVYDASLSYYFISNNYNGLATRFGLPPIVTSLADEDVQAFLNATGITDPAQIAAITTLVDNLKAYNLWNKMRAIYPLIGGTATTHQYNLKDPRNTDDAFRILWNGGIIHNSKGASFDGSSYGDTRFAPFSVLTNATQSNHLSIYISGSSPSSLSAAGNTNFIENGLGIGVGNQSRMNAYVGNNTAINITTNDGVTGLMAVTRTDLSNSAAYIRGSVTRTSTSTVAPPASPRTFNVFIGRENGAWMGTGANTYFSFASIGTGLTTGDVENLYTTVQLYNTSLNRAFNQ
jgi:hypothetical protein